MDTLDSSIVPNNDINMFPSDLTCEKCGDDGEEGGCPVCGLWPYKGLKEENEVKYCFVTNTEINSHLHQSYQRLKEKGIRILIEDATDRRRDPLLGHVGIWLAVEDRKIVGIPEFIVKIFPSLLFSNS